MNFPPNTESSVAPGMTFPVEAGETYTIKDQAGESLVIEARDDPIVIEFVQKFDEFLCVSKQLGEEHEASKGAWYWLMESFSRLPDRVKNNLVWFNNETIAVIKDLHV